MLEPGVAGPVTDQVGRPHSHRQRRRGPHLPGFLVAEIERLGRAVTDRIVVPRREPVLTAVSRPRTSQPRLGDHATKVGVGKDIDPWGWRPLAGRQIDHIFPSIRREPPISVVKEQVRGPLQGRCRRDLGGTGEHRHQLRQPDRALLQMRQVIGQRSGFVTQDRTRSRGQQYPVGLVHLIGPQQENPPTLIEPGIRAQAFDQAI